MTSNRERVANGRRALPAASRPWLAPFLAVAGAALLVLGWYGMAGRAVVAQQLPYLASATIPGAALVVAAAVLLRGESTARSVQRIEAIIDEISALLVEDGPEPATPEHDTPVPAMPAPSSDTTTTELVAVAHGTQFHRADCVAASGRPDREPVDGPAIAARALVPCPLCEPEPPQAPPCSR